MMLSGFLVGRATRSVECLKFRSVDVRIDMKFDQFTITLLILRPDSPKLDEKSASALQDAHLTHLAKLHESGLLLASGPLGGTDDKFRGLSILNVDPETALRLKQEDPAVRAGRFSVKVFRWMVPGGAIAFSPTRFPPSMVEAMGS